VLKEQAKLGLLPSLLVPRLLLPVLKEQALSVIQMFGESLMLPKLRIGRQLMLPKLRDGLKWMTNKHQIGQI
jgi:hypothetical protein